MYFPEIHLLPMLLVLALTFAMGVMGYGVLRLCMRDQLRDEHWLLAPAVGFGLLVLVLFLTNYYFSAIRPVAWLILLGWFAVAAALLVFTRQQEHRTQQDWWFFGALLLAHFLLVGWPILHAGFDWTALGNDDWANVNLAALRFQDHLYREAPDFNNLLSGKDYPGYYWFWFGLQAGRAGCDLILAWLASLTSLNPFKLQMVLLLSMQVAMVMAAFALVLPMLKERERRWLYAILLCLAPLLAWGVSQQLIAQIVGMMMLLLLAALAVPLLTQRMSWRQALAPLALYALLLIAFIIFYIEITPMLGLPLLLWLGWRILKKETLPTPLFFGLALLVLLVLVLPFAEQIYLLSFQFLFQLQRATAEIVDTTLLFPFFLVPSGLPALFGFQNILVLTPEPILSATIIAAALLLVAMVYVLVRRFQHFPWLGCLFLVLLVLGLQLFFARNDFGLFKLAMIAQPILFAWLVLLLPLPRQRPRLTLLGLVGLLGLLFAQQQVYTIVSDYRWGAGPFDMQAASLQKILTKPPVLPTENCHIEIDTSHIALAKLRISQLAPCQVDFISRFQMMSWINFLDGYLENDWLSGQNPDRQKLRDLRTQLTLNQTIDIGGQSFTRAAVAAVPAPYFGQEPRGATVLNWDSGHQLQILPRQDVRNHLVFVHTNESQHYYLPDNLKKIGLFQTQRDFVVGAGSMSALGQQLLFEVINPSSQVQVQLSLSMSPLKHLGSTLPRVTIVGEETVKVEPAGRGAMQWISQPVTPRKIDGRFYLLLRVEREPTSNPFSRSGLAGSYNQDINLDYRLMTIYARQIALRESTPTLPTLLMLPQDLLKPDTQFTGIYEDGWVSEQVKLRLQPTSQQNDLVIEGRRPQMSGQAETTTLKVSINGQSLHTTSIKSGDFKIVLPIAAAIKPVELMLEFTDPLRLPGADGWQVGAQLSKVGFMAANAP